MPDWSRVLCFVLFITSTGQYVTGQEYGDVRLVHGYDPSSNSFPTSGRLEVYTDPSWGTVCDTDGSFNQVAGNVACLQLGFSSAIKYGSVGQLGFYEGTGSVAISNVACYSSDLYSTLLSCNHLHNSCSHSNDVALSCRNSAGSNIRLVSWTGRTANISAGRLEVLYNGQWGTVCSIGFGDQEASIACRQLGFSNHRTYGDVGYLGVPSAASYVPNWLSNLNCYSSEVDLFSCSHDTIGDNTQHSHSLDVGLSCKGTGALQLVDDLSSSELPSAGRLEIYLNGEWGTIDDFFSSDEADVACKQLGFSSSTDSGQVYTYGYSEASSSTPMWLTNVNCYTGSQTLLDCDITVADADINNYYSHYDDLALICDSPSTTSSLPPYYEYSEPSLAAILGGIFGSLFFCSLVFVVTSLVCVTVACVRVKKKERRRCVQRNVVEESLPHDGTSYSGPSSYSAMHPPQESAPPPPPYSSVVAHRPSMQPVGNYSPATGHSQATFTGTIHPTSTTQPMQPVLNFTRNSMTQRESRPPFSPPLGSVPYYPEQGVVAASNSADIGIHSPVLETTSTSRGGEDMPSACPSSAHEQSAETQLPLLPPVRPSGYSHAPQTDEDDHDDDPNSEEQGSFNSEEQPLIS